jgi:acetyl-CoA carboxylase carboxyl transferase subunit beta
VTVAGVARGGEDVQWVTCPSCDAFVYAKRLARTLKVCPECNHHFRLRASERLAQLLDEGSFRDLAADVDAVDALSFTDSKPYGERLAEARKKTGAREAALYGPATVDGWSVVVAAMDFAFMGGSMGAAVGEVVTRAAELALATRTPLLLVSASGGARMQEGTVSLMQMAKAAGAIGKLREAGVPCFCLLTDPTFGGVTASFAMQGDVLVAFRTIVASSLGSLGGIGQTLNKISPLLLGGTAVMLGQRGGFFNIGVDGQMYAGAIVTTGVAFAVGAALLRRDPSPAQAIRFFTFSNTYLALLFAAVAVDTLIAS